VPQCPVLSLNGWPKRGTSGASCSFSSFWRHGCSTEQPCIELESTSAASKLLVLLSRASHFWTKHFLSSAICSLVLWISASLRLSSAFSCWTWACAGTEPQRVGWKPAAAGSDLVALAAHLLLLQLEFQVGQVCC
jgi:hypothetical protein